jgi:hypothetical protein
MSESPLVLAGRVEVDSKTQAGGEGGFWWMMRKMRMRL